MMICCRTKIVVPLLVVVTAMATFYVMDLVAEFHPTISDTLPMMNVNKNKNNENTQLFAVVVAPALSHDVDAQMEPLEYVLDTVFGITRFDEEGEGGSEADELHHQHQQHQQNAEGGEPADIPEVYQRFQDMTMAAAENFIVNGSDVSLASPVIQCSFQLYNVQQQEAPDENDMWTSRGVLIQATDLAQARKLVNDLVVAQAGVAAHSQSQSSSEQRQQQQQPEMPIFPPMIALAFGPGPFAHGSHPMHDSLVFSILSTYWVESLISLHWNTFGEQDKFAVLRVEVATQKTSSSNNNNDNVGYDPNMQVEQHVIMKPDSLDVYELLYPYPEEGEHDK